MAAVLRGGDGQIAANSGVDRAPSDRPAGERGIAPSAGFPTALRAVGTLACSAHGDVGRIARREQGLRVGGAAISRTNM